MRIGRDIGHGLDLGHWIAEQGGRGPRLQGRIPDIIAASVLELAHRRDRLAVHYKAPARPVLDPRRIDQVNQLVGRIGRGKAPGNAGRQIAKLAPGLARIGDNRIAQQALGLIDPVTGDKGAGFLSGKGIVDFCRQPVIHIDQGIIHQGLGRRRGGIEVKGWEIDDVQGRGDGFWPGCGLGHPAGAKADGRDRLAIDAGAHGLNLANIAHWAR